MRFLLSFSLIEELEAIILIFWFLSFSILIPTSSRPMFSILLLIPTALSTISALIVVLSPLIDFIWTSTNPDSIINCDCPMGLRIVVVSAFVTAPFFKSAVDNWFLESEKGDISKIEGRIEIFKNAFGKHISKGDEILMIYKPNRGINIYKNNEFEILIPGLDFKKALSKLWLGNNQIATKLKGGLLGLEK